MFKNKSDLLKDITKTYVDDGVHVCLMKKPYGNLLWSVWQHSNSGQSTLYIRLDVYKMCGGWVNETFLENDGFQFDNCPLKYIQSTPCIDEYWRGRVNKHHSHLFLWREIRDKFQRIRKKKTGEIIILDIDCDLKSKEFVLESLKPLRGRNMGRLWKIRKQTIKGYRIEPGTLI